MAYGYGGVQHRPAVTGREGMVSSAHPLATTAGFRTLMEGGNAIDAAIAVATTIGTTEIGMSGVGGVGWLQIYHAPTDTHICLDYQGMSPLAAERDVFAGPEEMMLGMKASMVPGSVAGWCAALERFGTMSRAEVFKYAIDICEHGHGLTVRAVELIHHAESFFRPYPSSVDFFCHEGELPRAGSLHRQTDLAETLRVLAEGGADAFYHGPIGEKIVAFYEANGGLITQDDLDALEVRWVDPIGIRYRDYEVFGPPPPSSAVQWLQTLKLLEGFDLAAMGHNSVEHLHTLLEAERLAIADRIQYNVQPDCPVDVLLSEEYLAERRALMNPDRASSSVGERFARSMAFGLVRPGDVMKRESTTHFNVADAEGSFVSGTQSLGGFGSGVVVPGTGILMNDFMYWFDLDADSPNVVAPRKKNEMCLSPGMIWRDGKVFACIGTPGSHGIMETTPQFMSNMMDFGMSVQAAIEAPRVRPQQATVVAAEGRISAEVLAGLEAKGNVIQRMPDYHMFFGGAQGIMVDPDSGVLTGGADPRRDGYAMGW